VMCLRWNPRTMCVCSYRGVRKFCSRCRCRQRWATTPITRNPPAGTRWSCASGCIEPEVGQDHHGAFSTASGTELTLLDFKVTFLALLATLTLLFYRCGPVAWMQMHVFACQTVSACRQHLAHSATSVIFAGVSGRLTASCGLRVAKL
jgi:hypothetical protein